MSLNSDQNKLIKVLSGSGKENFKELYDRIKSGELKWAYYSVDNGKGYHYYLKIK
jgi:hypothetical protein